MDIEKRASRGVTLVEILVVLVIVGVLILLLFPAKRAARVGARRLTVAASDKTDRVRLSAGDLPLVPPQSADESAGEGRADVGVTRSPAAEPATKTPTIPSRKIVYTSDISLRVKDFDTARTALERLVKAEGGYMASTDVTGSPGSPRNGSWKARVPVERFDAFREAVARLGELERSQTNSQDVTEEYYDLDARIQNKRVEEKRLLEHLASSTAKLSETLEVERELARVREEIERQQGRLNLLANLSTLTTVTVTLHSLETYTPESEPTLATTLGRTFRGSLGELRDVGKAILIAIVAIIPWLPVIGIVGFVVWRIARRLERLVRSRPLTTPAA